MMNATFAEAREIAAGTGWAYLATCRGPQPTVRPVHPYWGDDGIWIATGADSAKLRHLHTNPRVEIFWHLTEALRHLTVTGLASAVTDAQNKRRLWDVFDYDLSAYFPDGPAASTYALMRIEPVRIECWGLLEMGSGTAPRVWRKA